VYAKLMAAAGCFTSLLQHLLSVTASALPATSAALLYNSRNASHAPPVIVRLGWPASQQTVQDLRHVRQSAPTAIAFL
jgi:hypothetical protein